MNDDQFTEEHLLARNLYEAKRYPEAMETLLNLLDDNPDDPAALFLIGGIFIAQNKKGLAKNIMARCVKFAPDRAEAWVNYGRCQEDGPDGWAMTEWCMRKALEIHPDLKVALSNLGALELQRGNPDAAMPWLERALAIDPGYQVAQSTKGFAHLMRGEWREGWKLYHTMVGHRSRPDIQYGDLPVWDGTPGKTVIVNGEQGIGDELLYCEPLRDMAKDCTIIYDGMPRLKGLMTRSLPNNVYVAGGRWDDELVLPANLKPDARITQAGVCMYYRNTDDDFPGTPYLKADEGQRISMRAMLDSLGPGPKIGIAWTGGTKQSRLLYRRRTLEELTPILRIPGVQWVSLQYKDPHDEITEYHKRRGVTIHHMPWVTETKDYDLTAALVAELDLVVAVPTSVVQLAGGLGTQTVVMVPPVTGWLYNLNQYAWASSVAVQRDDGKPGFFKRVAREVERKIGRAALEAAV